MFVSSGLADVSSLALLVGLHHLCNTYNVNNVKVLIPRAHPNSVARDSVDDEGCSDPLLSKISSVICA